MCEFHPLTPNASVSGGFRTFGLARETGKILSGKHGILQGFPTVGIGHPRLPNEQHTRSPPRKFMYVHATSKHF